MPIPPDPTPLEDKRQWVVDLKWVKGEVFLTAVRKVELIGYIAAAVVLLIGMVIAMYTYGRAAHGQFIGWVFLAPLAAAGVIMIAVARWAAKREAAERQQRSAPKD